MTIREIEMIGQRRPSIFRGAAESAWRDTPGPSRKGIVFSLEAASSRNTFIPVQYQQ